MQGKISGGDYSGGIAGDNDPGTITACSFTGEVTSATRYAGGIVGYNKNGTITGCYSLATKVEANGTYPAGGITGQNADGTLTACHWLSGADVPAVAFGIDGNGQGTATNCHTFAGVSAFYAGNPNLMELMNAALAGKSFVWVDNSGGTSYPVAKAAGN